MSAKISSSSRRQFTPSFMKFLHTRDTSWKFRPVLRSVLGEIINYLGNRCNSCIYLSSPRESLSMTASNRVTGRQLTAPQRARIYCCQYRSETVTFLVCAVSWILCSKSSRQDHRNHYVRILRIILWHPTQLLSAKSANGSLQTPKAAESAGSKA